MYKQAPKIGFVSLGCPKNLVDSEIIITKLRSCGYEISQSYAGSDLVIVNTCGFINEAIEESLEVIGEALAENGKVLVTGCLGNRQEIILDKYPNILAISGAHAYEAVLKAVHKYLPIEQNQFNSLIPTEGVKLTPRHYAYLKISEGCNNKCTFCIIPSIRGKLTSRSIDKVLIEAERLAKTGVKELLVISQDTSAYGVDLKYKCSNWHNKSYQTRFYDLAAALSELGIWIRMHYIYPYPHVDKVVQLMAEGKILPYLDIPFQHANARILKLMKRPASSEDVLSSIQRWRKICPDLTIRSTFIVGFPGETEAEFEELLDFLQEAQMDRVGCFIYSAVDGAVANNLPEAVAEDVKQERLERFMALQANISAKKLQAKIGTHQEVLIDSINNDEDFALARTRYDAPDVDGVVVIENISSLELQKGTFVKVKIVAADEHDLVGEIIL